MFTDQATQLRRLVRDQTRATTIAITSGKGGVGKSNVAVNLAIKLTQAKKSVVVLDADLGLANADVLCNVSLPANLSHVLARKRELADVLVNAPGGFKLIGGASGLARMADLSDFDRQRIVDDLGKIEATHDIVIIDTGAGISPNVLCFTRPADHIIVVTTPEPTAIADAYATVKVISKDNVPRQLSLLVNQVRTPAEGKAVYERISRVAKQFLNVSIYDAGYIFDDPAVGTAVRTRVPFTLGSPRCPASACVAQLAGRLQQGVTPHGTSGFFQRVGRWLRSS